VPSADKLSDQIDSEDPDQWWRRRTARREGNLVGGVAAEALDAGGQAEHGVGFDGDAVVDEFGGVAWRSWWMSISTPACSQ
jgi:hypothetical protein